jgi:hypothetical protein
VVEQDGKAQVSGVQGETGPVLPQDGLPPEVEEINTLDHRVMSLAIPWCRVFDPRQTNLLIDALWRAAHFEDDTAYNAGDQITIHEARQILRMIELVRPYHRMYHKGVK